MASLTPVKYHSFVEFLSEKKMDLGSDVLKLALTNTAPNAATHTVLADITEISGDGYTAKTVTVSSSSQTGGIYELVTSGTITWTSTGTIGPFRYIVFFDDTASNDELIASYDIGSERTLHEGDSFEVDAGVTLVTLE
jgi:hypothetical protein